MGCMDVHENPAAIDALVDDWVLSVGIMDLLLFRRLE